MALASFPGGGTYQKTTNGPAVWNIPVGCKAGRETLLDTLQHVDAVLWTGRKTAAAEMGRFKVKLTHLS